MADVLYSGGVNVHTLTSHNPARRAAAACALATAAANHLADPGPPQELRMNLQVCLGWAQFQVLQSVGLGALAVLADVPETAVVVRELKSTKRCPNDQPVPLSNFVSDENSGKPQARQV